MGVRLTTAEDTTTIAIMLKHMARELFPEEATDDDRVYWDEVFKYMQDDAVYIFIDNLDRGFFMVKEDTDPIYPKMKRYLTVQVFIYEEYRKGRVLKTFYDKLFETFTEGEILGLTEAHSDHIPVLDKRHTHIANLYRLERS